MKIKKLTISHAELNQAVGDYLKTQGINIPVESVTKSYVGGKDNDYEVEFVEPAEKQIEVVEEKQ